MQMILVLRSHFPISRWFIESAGNLERPSLFASAPYRYCKPHTDPPHRNTELPFLIWLHSMVIGRKKADWNITKRKRKNSQPCLFRSLSRRVAQGILKQQSVTKTL